MPRLTSHMGALALGLSLLGSSMAFAGQPVSLRDDLRSAGAVTLGDLFDGAGPASSVVIGSGAPVGQSAVLDAGEVQRLAHIHGLDWDNASGIHRIIVLSTDTQVRENGAAAAKMVDTLTYARSLMAGEVIQPQDLTFAKVASFAVPGDAPRDSESVIGMMAKRPLRSGAPVSGHDVGPALVIRRDDVVDVVYRTDAINLVMQGKALDQASVGQSVSVLNPVSKKVFQAVAVGPDQAVVGPEAEDVRASNGFASSEFASR